MDMMTIIKASVSLGAMGLAFGAGLAFASQKFAVETDPRVMDILNVLPGANCGGCGYPGCGGFANAVVQGVAPTNGCPVGGAECAQNVAQIMGLEADLTAKKVARVLCNGGKNYATERFDYSGIEDCKAANMLHGGQKNCVYGCLGFGTCVRVCPFDAIHMNENGLAVVDPEKCTSCGKCLEACPKGIIEYVPYGQEVVVDCKNPEKGPQVKKNCQVACIACGLCEKACPFDAIKVENNYARIDYTKCTECMLCVEKCPTKAIAGDLANRKKAFILEDKCIGCTICAKKCPTEAITGELKKLHTVDPDKCIGCSICYEKCPKDAIVLK